MDRGCGCNADIVSRWLRKFPDSEQKLLVLPEGTNTNQEALLPFKTGAFEPGLPVQPVIVRHHNELDTMSWPRFLDEHPIKLLLLTLAQPFTRGTIECLSVYHPGTEEKSDPALYAHNVSLVMANALGIGVSKHSFRKWIEITLKERESLKDKDS